MGVEHTIIRNGSEPSWESHVAAACQECRHLSDEDVADVVLAARGVDPDSDVRRAVLVLVREERARADSS